MCDHVHVGCLSRVLLISHHLSFCLTLFSFLVFAALPFSVSLPFAFVHPFPLSLPLILSFSKLRVFMVFEGSCVLGVYL